MRRKTRSSRRQKSSQELTRRRSRLFPAGYEDALNELRKPGLEITFSVRPGSKPPTAEELQARWARYVSDVNTSLPVTLDDGTRKYVWGLGLAYAVSGSTLEVFHADRLGSIRAITDATGSVTATSRTDEYGVPTQITGGSTQPFGFAGEPADATGLSYLRARYLDPTLGRFLSRDTWAGARMIPTSLNRSIYAGASPQTYADPSGHCWPFCFAAVGAAIGAAAGGIAYTATHMTTFDGQEALGAVVGGAIAGAATGVAGPLGGTIAASLGFGTTSAVAVGAAIGIGAAGGAIATEAQALVSTCKVSSLTSSCQLAEPSLVLQGALLNGAASYLSAKFWPTQGVWSAKAAPYFGPHSWSTFWSGLRSGARNASALTRQSVASGAWGTASNLFPWSWPKSKALGG